MSCSELTVSFVYIYFGSQHPIQACFVDQVEVGFGITLICKIIELKESFMRNKDIETQNKQRKDVN